MTFKLIGCPQFSCLWLFAFFPAKTLGLLLALVRFYSNQVLFSSPSPIQLRRLVLAEMQCLPSTPVVGHVRVELNDCMPARHWMEVGASGGSAESYAEGAHLHKEIPSENR